MNRRRLLLLGLVVLVASYLVAGGLGVLTGGPTDREKLERERLVQPAEGGSYLWPYTSRERGADGRTLAINMIVHGSDDRVRQALDDRTELEWEETDPDEEAVEAETYEVSVEDGGVDWDDAHGSTRYTYVDTGPHGGGGVWIDEGYQLHAGTYLGSRHHIRAYTTRSDDWTAIQTHQEYWDWFRLRHTVTGTQSSRNDLESEFIGQPYVEEVRREHHGIDEGGSDGWLSVIELESAPSGTGVAILGLIGILTRETRRAVYGETRRLLGWTLANTRGFVLAAALGGLYLGVRSAGLFLEATVPLLSPKTFVAVLYPVLVVGLPIVAVVLARPFEAAGRLVGLQRIVGLLGRSLEPLPAFGFTLVGLGAAFVMDFAGLGVAAVPIELFLHRIGLTVALGLIAAGAARSDTRGRALLALGLTGWAVGLGMALFGYL
ncbi:hypothetical protein [Halalkalicoccus jeotgali]|uniref:Uncharacterized protein n=1 Tax=Halalkalicoccus jeotgali (strain DSM 18796 / CECT 7217 / JCM 14584 / KCTC 4019 / B3) TaxID=795797 RepID=D8J419_HALJB|nr:hypothetical protein [Halalkalicoccus jeotgali]ADJ15411.1 hypothetical protein HacjB3_10140 [Halalkalicoccus jeotgali B3]ELY35813.1 hypothetical protein C497_12531 [Halalkalicoccus jeotgali B3]